MAVDYFAEKAKRQAKKISNRTGEKLLRKLGAEQTRDPEFEELESTFNTHVKETEALKKALKRYLYIIKESRRCVRKLHDILSEFYDDTWPGAAEYKEGLLKIEGIWKSYEKMMHKLRDPVRRYELEFKDIKERIKKHHNKQLDFDVCKRTLQKMYEDPKVPAAKVAKAEDEFEEVQGEYKEVNAELKTDIPIVLHSRVGFVKNCFAKLAATNERFSKETAQPYKLVKGILANLSVQGLPQPTVKPTHLQSRPGGGNVKRSFRRQNTTGNPLIPTAGVSGAAPMNNYGQVQQQGIMQQQYMYAAPNIATGQTAAVSPFVQAPPVGAVPPTADGHAAQQDGSGQNDQVTTESLTKLMLKQMSHEPADGAAVAGPEDAPKPQARRVSLGVARRMSVWEGDEPKS